MPSRLLTRAVKSCQPGSGRLRAALQKGEHHVSVSIRTARYSTVNAEPSGRSSGKRRFLREGYVATLIGIAIGATAYGFSPSSDATGPPGVSRFNVFKIQSMEEIAPASRLYRISPQAAHIESPSLEESSDDTLPLVWSIELKQPHLQIARRYSPLPAKQTNEGTDQSLDKDLQLYISGKHGGEMSRYIFSLLPGSSIEARGPFVEYRAPKSLKELVLIGGGTGIAPLLQAAARGLEIPDCKVQILWANRELDACRGALIERTDRLSSMANIWTGLLDLFQGPSQPVEQHTPGPIVAAVGSLQAQHPDRLTLRCFVDEQNSFISAGAIQQSLSNASALPVDPDPQSRLVLVCGSDGFIDYVAGSKPALGQGPVGGLLASTEARSQGWSVWKLA